MIVLCDTDVWLFRSLWIVYVRSNVAGVKDPNTGRARLDSLAFHTNKGTSPDCRRAQSSRRNSIERGRTSRLRTTFFEEGVPYRNVNRGWFETLVQSQLRSSWRQRGVVMTTWTVGPRGPNYPKLRRTSGRLR